MIQQPIVIPSDVFTLVSFFVGIVSLVVGIVALALAWLFKRDADRVNKDTTGLLVEIRSDAKKIASTADLAIGELQKYGDTHRQLIIGLISGKTASQGPTYDVPGTAAASGSSESAGGTVGNN